MSNLFHSFQAKGYLTMSYNLGTEDIIVHDKTKKLNDGNHHVVRCVFKKIIHH